MELVKIGKVKPNKDNPRVIKEDKFKKLVNSIKEFPEMLKLRPIVVNKDMIVLGGNMRLKACAEAGLKEVYILKAEGLTEEQEREFIIKDNVGFGEWDWDILANEWDALEMESFGLDVWQFPVEIDYTLLEDEDDISNKIEDMANGVKKAVQIEFHPDHYLEAYELIKYWRSKGAYVGKMIMDYLNTEKNKL